MLKLYKNINGVLHYWETWENGNFSMIHWGILGENGESKKVTGGIFSSSKKIIQGEVNKKISEGFEKIPEDSLKWLVIEYKVDGHGTTSDLEKRDRIESKLKETLGWTGLGDCDGGSMGSGTMEIFCPVVSFEIAKKVIENSFENTEFSDYTKIYVRDSV